MCFQRHVRTSLSLDSYAYIGSEADYDRLVSEVKASRKGELYRGILAEGFEKGNIIVTPDMYNRIPKVGDTVSNRDGKSWPYLGSMFVRFHLVDIPGAVNLLVHFVKETDGQNRSPLLSITALAKNGMTIIITKSGATLCCGGKRSNLTLDSHGMPFLYVQGKSSHKRGRESEEFKSNKRVKTFVPRGFDYSKDPRGSDQNESQPEAAVRVGFAVTGPSKK